MKQFEKSFHESKENEQAQPTKKARRSDTPLQPSKKKNSQAAKKKTTKKTTTKKTTTKKSKKVSSFKLVLIDVYSVHGFFLATWKFVLSKLNLFISRRLKSLLWN